MTPLSTLERQKNYQCKIQTGELKRIQMVLPLEIRIKADYLCKAGGCTKKALFTKLLLEEWERQGSPVPEE